MMTNSNQRNRLRLSHLGLNRVDARLEQLGWGKQSDIWAQQAAVSVSTLRRFRGCRHITSDTFRSICDALGLDWADLVYCENSNSFSTDTAYFCVAREQDVEELSQAIQAGSRVIVITGITGIGKTVLAEQLMQLRLSAQAHLITLNCELPCNQASFLDVALCNLRQVGELVTDVEQKSPQQILRRWIAYLNEHECWLLLDSVEYILRGNERTGWSSFIDPLWDDFFHQILGQADCRSHFILTSQDMPADIDVHGQRYPKLLHVYPLSGFTEQQQANLFQSHGFTAESSLEAWGYLMRIGQAYAGHPLALQVILGEIDELFESNVERYWQSYGHEIEKVEAMNSSSEIMIGDRPQIDRYSQRLRRAVRERIEKTFSRLQRDSADAFLLLCTTAVYREAVSELFILTPMLRRGWTPERGQVALDMLIDRYLLEVDRYGTLRQHPLIRSVALSYFDASDTSPEAP